jgi:hypothetical protein
VQAPFPSTAWIISFSKYTLIDKMCALYEDNSVN